MSIVSFWRYFYRDCVCYFAIIRVDVSAIVRLSYRCINFKVFLYTIMPLHHACTSSPLPWCDIANIESAPPSLIEEEEEHEALTEASVLNNLWLMG